MLETIEEPLTKELLCDYHRILKTGTTDDLENDDFVVGGWKTIPNAVANIQTTRPADVDYEMARLLSAYHEKANKTYRDMAGFHVFFEDMRDLYFKEFSCLVPQNYLLPRFESFTKQVNLSPEGFFGKE